jgi:hypothetical protein
VLVDAALTVGVEWLGPAKAMARATVTSTAVPMTNAMPEAVESRELIFGMRGMIAILRRSVIRKPQLRVTTR